MDDAISMFASNPDLYAYADLDRLRREKGLVEVPNFHDKTRDVSSFGLVKESEYLECFNHHLAKIKESGLLKRIATKWKLEEPPETDSGTEQPKALGFDDLFLPFVAVAVGVFGALVSVSIEKLSL